MVKNDSTIYRTTSWAAAWKDRKIPMIWVKFHSSIIIASCLGFLLVGTGSSVVVPLQEGLVVTFVMACSINYFGNRLSVRAFATSSLSWSITWLIFTWTNLLVGASLGSFSYSWPFISKKAKLSQAAAGRQAGGIFLFFVVSSLSLLQSCCRNATV